MILKILVRLIEMLVTPLLGRGARGEVLEFSLDLFVNFASMQTVKVVKMKKRKVCFTS